MLSFHLIRMGKIAPQGYMDGSDSFEYFSISLYFLLSSQCILQCWKFMFKKKKTLKNSYFKAGDMLAVYESININNNINGQYADASSGKAQ